MLWVNLRAAFYPEIAAMYKTMRTNSDFNYAAVEKRFEDHQSVWSESLYNEDSQFKYLDPLIYGAQDPENPSQTKKTAAYLSMLQGSKAEHRKWWLYNRFNYIDSKYNAGSAQTNKITVRGYANGDITVIPFVDIYPAVLFGSALVMERGKANVATTLECPSNMGALNDTEIYIYSANAIKEISDLTDLKIGYCDFADAIKLQSITIHDDVNPNMNLGIKGNGLDLGNNTLLKTLICRNAPNLKQAIDLSGCESIETVDFTDTAITGVVLANGSTIETLSIPDTITTISFINDLDLSDLTIGEFNVNETIDEDDFTILTINTTTLISKNITLTSNADNTMTSTVKFPDDGSVTFIIKNTGSYTATCEDNEIEVSITDLSEVEYISTLEIPNL